MKSEIYQWKQSGNIYFWLFLDNTKNFPGYNMSFDADGKNSLLSLVRTLKGSSVKKYRTVKLSVPTKNVLAIPNNGVNILTGRSIKIFYDERSSVGIKYFSNNFELRGDSILFGFIEEKLTSIKLGEELGVKVGGDYLNFWW